MESLAPYAFRFVAYTFFGLSLEMIFSVTGIEHALGCRVHRRVPRKYLEGFVSLYMIPLHGLGLLFGFEPVLAAIADWAWPLRFLVYAVAISGAEVLWGFFLDKTVGFYPWDYYADSRFKVFRRGYTLWTLVPLWGIAGLILEAYAGLLLYLSPYVRAYVAG